MTTETRQVVSDSSVRPLHPAMRVLLATFVALVWATALGGNIYWSFQQAGRTNLAASSAPAVAVVTRPAHHGPGHVAEIVNIGEEPLEVCVRPGRLARQLADGEQEFREYCTTVPPCSVLGVGWKQGMAWEPGDEVVVEISNSVEIRATVR
ncbi:MAG: hypothetical protein ACREJO_03990 [Phycisphaerales bacterium]